MTDGGELVGRAAPVLGFLLAITVVAQLADAAGVFDVAARRAARLARGRVPALWLLTVALSCVCTIVLSLDTTAVLLTPVLLQTARRCGLDPLPFAFTGVWLANTASLLLPVSNLTNLLALHRFSGVGDYTAHLWPVAVASLVATVLAAGLLFARRLRGRFEVDVRRTPHDPVLLRTAAVVCVLLGPAFVSGLAPWISATVAAAVLGAVTAVRSRDTLRTLRPPWLMVVAVAALFVAADAFDRHGGRSLIQSLLGDGSGAVDLARVAGVSGAIANLGNNLPAFLLLDHAVGTSTDRAAALLVGVNVLPIVLPWGSLATQLWHQRCRAAGVSVPWGRYVALSLVVTLASGAAAWGALALS